MEETNYKVRESNGQFLVVPSASRDEAALLWGKSMFLGLDAEDARNRFSKGIEVSVEDSEGSSKMLVIMSIDVYNLDESSS
tara:strand:- start:1010 stop:1252 length:243 start_codon:yes stop_codon:yes gene_type:complete